MITEYKIKNTIHLLLREFTEICAFIIYNDINTYNIFNFNLKDIILIKFLFN